MSIFSFLDIFFYPFIISHGLDGVSATRVPVNKFTLLINSALKALDQFMY